MTGDAPVWLFDGHCVLCSRSVAFALRWEREPRMRFVAIQSAEGRELARRHGIDPDDPETFLFLQDGVAHARSDGVIALARHLRTPWRWLAGLRFVPRALRDGAYDRVARNRYRLFGRSESCLAPDARLRARFVLPD